MGREPKEEAVIDPNKPVVSAINYGTPVEIAGSIVGVGAAFAGAPRLAGVALIGTGLYDAFNRRKGYGALYGALGLVMFFLPELKDAIPTANASPSLPPPTRPQKVVNMPDGDGTSLSIPASGLIWVNFLNDLPPGYQWALSFTGDFVADIKKANTGNVPNAKPVYTVEPRGTGNNKITFTAYKYDANGNPSSDPTAPVYMVSFYLNAY